MTKAFAAYVPSSDELPEFGDEISVKSHVNADVVAFWSDLFERMYTADTAHVTSTRHPQQVSRPVGKTRPTGRYQNE